MASITINFDEKTDLTVAYTKIQKLFPEAKITKSEKKPLEPALGIAPMFENSISDKEKAFKSILGILSGYEIDLDKEREERILSK